MSTMTPEEQAAHEARKKKLKGQVLSGGVAIAGVVAVFGLGVWLIDPTRKRGKKKR